VSIPPVANVSHTKQTDIAIVPNGVSLVCAGCGCLCDDIDWNPDHPSEFSSACDLGKKYFQHLSRRSLGADSATAETIQELAKALGSAGRPLVTGLHQSCLETQRFAVAIADRCYGVIDPFLANAARAKTIAFQQSGEITASWGEVKNRADVIVYWRCRPDRAPRFRQRYGDLSVGHFIQPSERTVIVVDSSPDRTLWESDDDSSTSPQYVTIGENDRITFEQLIAAGRDAGDGGSLPNPEDEPTPPQAMVAKPAWWPVHQALSRAQYGAVVVGELHAGSPTNDTLELVSTYQWLQRWMAQGNEGRRRVAVPFAGSTNHGRAAQAVLTWRTGYPMSVDFSAGFPRYDSTAFHWRECVARNEVDLVLFFSGDSGPVSTNSPWANDYQRLTAWAEHRPLWEIGTHQTIPTARRFLSTLAKPTGPATTGTTVGRPDGVLLPVRNVPTTIMNFESELSAEIWRRLNHEGA
jgi:formylmethanofuran dehydrogenase subunit B